MSSFCDQHSVSRSLVEGTDQCGLSASVMGDFSLHEIETSLSGGNRANIFRINILSSFNKVCFYLI